MTQEMTIMKIILAAVAAMAFASAASAATTQDPFVQDKAIVQIKGLDLSTADGQQRLANRMDQAARAVCGENLASIHLSLESEARECRTTVLANIRTQIETRTADATSGSPVRVASIR
jgi:UrcA family protein